MIEVGFSPWLLNPSPLKGKTVMGYALGCLTFRYATFSGRARRMEYWMFCLLCIILSIAVGFADGMMNPHSPPTEIGTLSLFFNLLLIIPSIAVTVRRLHDTNRTGWWWFIALIPILGTIWLLVLMAWPGTRGSNDYGDDPIHHTTSRQDVLNALGRTG